MLLSFDRNALLRHLINSYSWQEVESICDYQSKLIKCQFKNSNNTPLHEICNIGSAPGNLVVKILLCWKDAALKQNKHGDTPLHIKCRVSQYSSHVLRILVETNKEALTITNKMGQTPLHAACLTGASFLVIKILVSTYPDALFIRDVNGHSPLDLLWSAFAKTIPGASAVSKYLDSGGGKDNDDDDAKNEMSGLLFRFLEKLSFCVMHSYNLICPSSIIKDDDNDDDDDNNENKNENGNGNGKKLLCHAIISERFNHCPHTLLNIVLIHQSKLGCQVDYDGDTPLHLLIHNRSWDHESLNVILDKSKESASIPNKEGLLPLHVAIHKLKDDNDGDSGNGNDSDGVVTYRERLKDRNIIYLLVSAFPEALVTKDPKTGLYPFMTVAKLNNLETTYDFLNMVPEVVVSL